MTKQIFISISLRSLFFYYYFATIPRSFSVEKVTVESRFRFSGNGKWRKNKRKSRICAASSKLWRYDRRPSGHDIAFKG